MLCETYETRKAAKHEFAQHLLDTMTPEQLAAELSKVLINYVLHTRANKDRTFTIFAAKKMTDDDFKTNYDEQDGE